MTTPRKKRATTKKRNTKASKTSPKKSKNNIEEIKSEVVKETPPIDTEKKSKDKLPSDQENDKKNELVYDESKMNSLKSNHPLLSMQAGTPQYLFDTFIKGTEVGRELYLKYDPSKPSEIPETVAQSPTQAPNVSNNTNPILPKSKNKKTPKPYVPPAPFTLNESNMDIYSNSIMDVVNGHFRKLTRKELVELLERGKYPFKWQIQNKQNSSTEVCVKFTTDEGEIYRVPKEKKTYIEIIP